MSKGQMDEMVGSIVRAMIRQEVARALGAREEVSNTVGRTYGAALADVEQTRNDPVPLHLRNAPTGLMRGLGYGKDYHYAHDDYAVKQFNLPENLRGRVYYEPGKNEK